MKQINQAPRYVYFPEKQYTHPATKSCINSIHHIEPKQDLTKKRHILIKRATTKEADRPKDKQLTKENYTAEAKGHKMAKQKSQPVCLQPTRQPTGPPS